MQEIFRRSAGPFFALGLLVLILFSLTKASDYAVPIAVAVFVWMLINAMASTETVPNIDATMIRIIRPGIVSRISMTI